MQDTARISTIIERQHKKEAERKASGRDVDSLVKGDYTNYNASSSKFKAAAKFIQVRTQHRCLFGGLSFSSVPKGPHETIVSAYLSGRHQESLSLVTAQCETSVACTLSLRLPNLSGLELTIGRRVGTRQLKFASENNLKVAGGGLTSTAGAAAMQPKPKPNAVSTPATKESLKQPQPAAPAARVRPRTAPVRRRTSPQKRSAKDSAGGVHSKEGTRQWAVGCDRQRSNWAKVLTWQPITVKRRDPKLDPRHRNESVWVNPGVYKTLTIES